MERTLELLVLATLDNTGHLCLHGAVVVLEVLGTVGHAVTLLVLGGTLANPDNDSVANVGDEDVVGVER